MSITGWCVSLSAAALIPAVFLSPPAMAQDKKAPALYRIWPDFEVSRQTNASLSTIKADAAHKAFCALGDGIVWAVMDSGIDGKHPHFNDHKNLDLPAPLRHCDFTTFGTWDPEEAEESRIRTVYSSQLKRCDKTEEVVYEVRGRSFLRYQVRKMVGTLIEVGKGRLKPEDIPRLFEARDRAQSGFTAPPEGLCLVEVEYPTEIVAAPAAWDSPSDP